MHPTADTTALMLRERLGAAGDAGRSAACLETSLVDSGGRAHEKKKVALMCGHGLCSRAGGESSVSPTVPRSAWLQSAAPPNNGMQRTRFHEVFYYQSLVRAADAERSAATCSFNPCREASRLSAARGFYNSIAFLLFLSSWTKVL